MQHQIVFLLTFALILMGFFCNECSTSYPTRSSLASHYNRYHRHPIPDQAHIKEHFHPDLNALKFDSQGNQCGVDDLPHNPPPRPYDWDPFKSRPNFEFVERTYEGEQSAKPSVNHLLDILAAQRILDGETNPEGGFFGSHDELLVAIDAIKLGPTSWNSFVVRYTGPVDDNSPSWKRQEYVVHARDIREAYHTTLGNRDLDGKFDTRPYKRWVKGQRTYSDLMSSAWAWKKATKIAENPQTHGAMLVPIILGADKTTVSVATGNQEYHPVYTSPGNVHNDVRRAHRDALIPIAFLATPKGSRESDDDPEFRLFKKQLYHASLAQILLPLRDAMTTPELVLCPDGHFRKVIYEIGPFIADYPEQVALAGIVQGWCPKCLALPKDLENTGEPRFREHTDLLKETHTHDPTILWDAFGIVSNVIPFTSHFPRADIHELITPDLLHQVIKGTFKDHLVTWVEEYINATHTPKEAKIIMDDIDRRIAAVPAFPGLRRFPEGRRYKQWTGDDSKALMKVFVPAIVGHVPDRVVKAIVAFLDFCYIARRPSHTEASLRDMDSALDRFHHYRQVFLDENIRSDFSLPRQHALVHYVHNIRLFGSPNGICSSITESKHIRAVKEPWRRGSRNGAALEGMIETNVRLSKLAAARADFGARGMLKNDVLTAAHVETGFLGSMDIIGGRDGGEDPQSEKEVNRYERGRRVVDVEDVDDEVAPIEVSLAKRYHSKHFIQDLAHDTAVPYLETLVRRFLYDQRYPDPELDAMDVRVEDCPTIDGKVAIFRSARATWYAPSELAGPTGMHSEVIRSTPSWFRRYERRDTVLIQDGSEDEGMRGMAVGRVLLFMSVTHDDEEYPCALVEWMEPVGDGPDSVTGMWIVKPAKEGGRREAHLPKKFKFWESHLAFKAFYVNKYSDYHAHEEGP